MAMNTISICHEDTDIVNHGRLFQKTGIQIQFRMNSGNLHATVSHLSAMAQQYLL